MTIAALEQNISADSGGTFTVTATDLDVPDITTLFTKYLPNATLTLANSQANTQQPNVASGTLTLGGTQIAAQATFVADTSGVYVAGVVIVADLTDWTLTAAGLNFNLGDAAHYLGAPQLCLQAGGAAQTPEALLVGTVSLKSHPFTLMATVPTDTTSPALFQPQGTLSFSLQELLTALHSTLTIPDGLDFTLQSLTVVAQIQQGSSTDDNPSLFVLAAQSNYGALLFVALKGSALTFLLSAAPAISGSLTDIPVIGADLPAALSLALDSVNLLVSSGDLSDDQVTGLNTALSALPLPQGTNWQITAAEIDTTGQLDFALTIAGAATDFDLDISGGSSAVGRGMPMAQEGADSTKWLSIQKAFGPLSVQRVGFAYSDGQAEFLLDAGLSLGPVDVSLTGLSVSSPLTHFSPTFGLHGMGLSLTTSALSISAAFLNTQGQIGDPTWEYAGEITLQTPEFSLAGIGAYGNLNGKTSLFLFAMLDAPLGGPAFFFVTGLALGFGYNRSLNIPPLDDLPDFPLVAAAMSGETGSNPFSGITNDPDKCLEVLDSYLPMTIGEDWGAIGVRFTSFELVQSFALATVSFGTRFELALLGLSAISVPPLEPEPVGYAELALEVTLAPADGQLTVAGQLTPASYILSKACQLTGGFAFYLWYKDDPLTGASAGEFVVSLGGYYPGYTIPSYYPTVPIIGANWQVSEQLLIKGGVYFALLPHAVMAGGYLQANWQSGDLQAWFNADANFLLSWKPFHYQADMSLSLGASYKLDLGFVSHTFTIHVGVDLTLWGPPFGGTAYVDLDVVSFTIDFGKQNPAAPPTPWQEFKASFLPAGSSSSTRVLTGATTPDSICTTQVAAGMLRDLTRTPNALNLDWVVSPENFQLLTNSVVPTTAANWVTGSSAGSNQTTPLEGVFPATFGVGPCAIPDGGLDSVHTITLNRLLDSGIPDYTTPIDSSLLAITQNTANIARAPWSKLLSYDLVQNPSIATVNANPATIPGLVTGYTIAPLLPIPDEAPTPIPFSILDEEVDGTQTFSWSPTVAPITDDFDQNTALAQFITTIDSSTVSTVRAAILGELIAQGLSVAPTVDVSDMTTVAGADLVFPPLLSLLGEERPLTSTGV